MRVNNNKLKGNFKDMSVRACYSVSKTGVTWGFDPQLTSPLPKTYSGVPWTPDVTPGRPDLHIQLYSDQTRYYKQNNKAPFTLLSVEILLNMPVLANVSCRENQSLESLYYKTGM